jgi:hypothetical protein
VREGCIEGGINTVGCFEGFIKEHLEEDFAVQGIAQSFITEAMTQMLDPNYINKGNMQAAEWDSNYSPENDNNMQSFYDVGLTMFDLPSDAEIDEFSPEDLMSFSVLDYMRYADEDLLLDPVALDDISTDEGKERLLNTVVTNFNRKVSKMYKEPLAVSDAVLKNAIPDKVDSGIDILNINGDFRTDSYGETEISRIAFNRTNLMKATRLIAKVLQRFNKIEKANAKAASST